MPADRSGINWKHFLRRVHYWVAIVVLVPFAVILVSGIFLQLKKPVDWIQPPTQRGSVDAPSVAFDTVLAAVRAVPQAEVDSWADIERLDVRPDRGLIKVKARNDWEVQLDAATGEVLQVAFRRSDLIEDIHDGSFFHAAVKFGVFLPTAVGLAVLLMTGGYLFVLPIWVRRRLRGR